MIALPPGSNDGLAVETSEASMAMHLTNLLAGWSKQLQGVWWRYCKLINSLRAYTEHILDQALWANVLGWVISVTIFIG